MSSEPPPSYSPEPPSSEGEDASSDAANVEPQILIVPIGNNIGFQQGYLGVDGERAAIEGELQIKAQSNHQWERILLSLQSVEQADSARILLADTVVELHTAAASNGPGSARSSFLFAIPLPPDTPQCVHTAHTALTHTLTASAFSGPGAANCVRKAVAVHTRRYSPHSHACAVAPETRVLAEPARVEVQVPRTSFMVGEPVPVYVTVPVPRAELVTQQGLRLRNVRAELVRSVKARTLEYEDALWDADGLSDDEQPAADDGKAGDQPSSSQIADARTPHNVHQEQKVVSLSGASCRFHPARPIRLRLILHPATQSPLAASTSATPGEYHARDGEECASISQKTILHSVSFKLRVHVAFMHMSTHTERVATASIPLVVLPPSAPLPEVEEAVDTAYHKKHDRPPARTVRVDDVAAPRYEEGKAGPSILSGAPPPFEEREAPPPFSTEPGAGGSTSSRLPTFLESEREIYVPANDDPGMGMGLEPPPLPDQYEIAGEGTLFGFPPSEQFDGYADSDRSVTPPPTVEMASRDTNVTQLANLNPSDAIEAMGLALGLDHLEEGMHDGPPPPPPPMDDPSDPPPSIDSAFRGAGGTHQTPVISPQSHVSAGQNMHSPNEVHDGHAPPPYRIPDHGEDGHDHDHTAGPPPYMDLVHH